MGLSIILLLVWVDVRSCDWSPVHSVITTWSPVAGAAGRWLLLDLIHHCAAGVVHWCNFNDFSGRCRGKVQEAPWLTSHPSSGSWN